MDVHAHSCLASFTEREICNHFGREKTHQNINKSEEKPQKVLIVASFEGDNERAQYPSLKNIFI